MSPIVALVSSFILGGCKATELRTIDPLILSAYTHSPREAGEEIKIGMSVMDNDPVDDLIIGEAHISNDTFEMNLPMLCDHLEEIDEGDTYSCSLQDTLLPITFDIGTYDVTFRATDIQYRPFSHSEEFISNGLGINEFTGLCESESHLVMNPLEKTYNNDEIIIIEADLTLAKNCTVDSIVATMDGIEAPMTLNGGLYQTTFDTSEIILTTSPQKVEANVTLVAGDYTTIESTFTNITDVVAPIINGPLNITADNETNSADNLADTTITFTIENPTDAGVGVAEICAEINDSFCQQLIYNTDDTWSFSTTGASLIAPESTIELYATDGAGNTSDVFSETFDVEDITGIVLSSVEFDPSSVNDNSWGDVSITVEANDMQDPSEDLTVYCQVYLTDIPLAHIGGDTFTTSFDSSSITPNIGIYSPSCFAYDTEGHYAIQTASFEVEDCDTSEAATTWHADSDLDGYVSLFDTIDACIQPDGYFPLTEEDCNDDNDEVHPGATEYCNETDNDCDGVADNDAEDASTWYQDNDGDDFGSTITEEDCDVPKGYTSIPGDCDDDNEDIYPDAPELCNDTDDDCDEVIDNDVTDGSTWYADGDLDGYGSDTDSIEACDASDTYSTEVAGDCDDTRIGVHPDAEEICYDGLDNDCDGTSSCAYSGTINAGELIEITGEEGIGEAIAGADLDADGLSDIVLGISRDDTIGEDAGAVFVHYGLITASANVEELDGYIISGEVAGDMAGSAVTIIGDVTDDGSVDIAIGAPGESTGGSYAGAVYIVHGVPGDMNLSDAEVKLTGVSAGYYTGNAISGAGDFNDDSIADLIVGCLYADDGGTRSGTAYLLLGPVTSKSLDEAEITFVGENEGDLAGTAVTGEIDIDGDGISDVAIGAEEADSYFGATYVVYGSEILGTVDLSDADAKIEGVAAVDDAGAAITFISDFDGDGYNDLGVGARYNDCSGTNSGAAYLVRGPVSSGSLSDAYTIFCGGFNNDNFGDALNSMDFNSDDLGDLVVGAYAEDSGGSSAGAAYVFASVTSGSFDTSDASLIISGGAADAQLGTTIAGIGDNNGDGLEDQLFGAPGDNTAYLLFGDGY